MHFAPGAWRIAVIPTVVAVPLLLVVPLASVALFVMSAGILFFYRDPDRTPPASGVVAPADGRVTVLRTEGEQVRVGIFMNVTDVHVNRAPIATTVSDVTHEPGANRPAFSKESDRNERVTIDCGDHEIVLIAGWFARRITPYVSEGTTVARGERIGHIAFGSRVDVLLPATIAVEDVTVHPGESVRAGETVIASASDETKELRG